MNIHHLKKVIFDTLEFREKGKIAAIISTFLLLVIILNIPIVILESFDNLGFRSSVVLYIADVLVTIIFTIEYILRLFSCTVEKKYSLPIFGRLKFAATPMMIIDLVAILPFYIFNFKYIQVVRFLRIFRIFKIVRYSRAFQDIFRILKNRKDELLVFLFFLSFILVGNSYLLYFAEHDAQPEVFSNIFDAMWCVVITLTSVGYGDIAPITGMGKFIAGFTAILGVFTFAIPVAILAAGFTREIQGAKNKSLNSRK